MAVFDKLLHYRLLCVSRCLLTGFAQVVFQERLLSGLLCVLAVGLYSTVMLLGAVLGASASLSSAYLLGYQRQQLARGLYGYNGVLIGLVLFAFYTPDAVTCLLVVGAAALSSVLHAGLQRTAIVPLTAAFIVLTWSILAVAAYLPLTAAFTAASATPPSVLGYLGGVAAGLGQIFFLNSPWSGICIFLALLVSSARLAGWALLGSAAGLLIAWWLVGDSARLLHGLYGYNGALVALAVASRFPASCLLPLVAIAISTVLSAAIYYAGLVPLTAPFVLAAWLVFAVAPSSPSSPAASRKSAVTAGCDAQ